jgi:hypothetical protein
VNRIQRARRFRLASLALTLGAVLAVSIFPAAAPALAGPNDTIKITPAAPVAGANGSTFTVNVVANAAVATNGVQASVTFDKAVLQIQSAAYAATGYGALPTKTPAPAPAPGLTNAITAANGSGKLATISTADFSDSIPAGGADKAFFSVTFSVVACPASGTTNLGLPVGGLDALFTYDTGLSVIADPVTTGATVTCTYTPPTADAFSLSANPAAVTIAQGGTSASTITATLVSGAPGNVTLAASGVPANVTATFGSTTLAPTANTTLTFNVGAAAAIGSSTVTVTGTAAGSTQTATITLNITAPASGPTPATGTTTVTGTVEAGFLGVTVPANTALTLRRNAVNEASIPVLIFSNSTWTLKIEDAMLAGKAASDRGHMLDTSGLPVKSLAAAMQAYVPVVSPAVPLVRTLDVVGPQSLTTGSNGATVPVTISQLTQPADQPGNYAIDLKFTAISGF